MATRAPHLSRPVYEGLPWLYVIVGLGALGGSYVFAARGFLSLCFAALGLCALLAGLVVLLRRRDYRDMRSQYGEQEDLTRKEP
jgi:hypothetical protein